MRNKEIEEVENTITTHNTGIDPCLISARTSDRLAELISQRNTNANELAEISRQILVETRQPTTLSYILAMMLSIEQIIKEA